MLARLLGPHGIGTYAVAYVALTAVLTFNELGVSLAIVRWRGEPGEIVPTVTSISMLVSVLIYATCYFAAPLYASAMGAPTATGVVRVLAVVVIIDGFTNTPIALMQRTFRQGQRTIADQLNVWLGMAVTVALAWSGYGAMSLAIGRLVGCLAGAIMMVVFVPESLRLGFSRAKARDLLRFGLPLAGSNLIAFAITSVDQLVVGHILGAVALGFYVLALNLSNWPITVFSQPVGNVAPAVFSRLQHDRSTMRTTFLSAGGLLCAVAMPVCLLIGGSAPALIGFVYGARWLPAAQPLIWLALLGAIQIFLLLAYDLFVVLARSRFLLLIQFAWLLALVPALAVGARADGIYGAAAAEAAVAAVGVLPWYLRELNKVGIRLRDLGKHLWLPAGGAVFAGLVAAGASRVLPDDFTALAVSGVVMVAVIALLVYRMRSVIVLLRSVPVEPGAAIRTEPGSVASPGEPLCDLDMRAAPGVIDAATVRHGDLAEGLLAPHEVRLPSPPRYNPVAASRSTANGHSAAEGDEIAWPHYQTMHQDLIANSPLYLRTIESLRWDPGLAIERRPEAPVARTQWIPDRTAWDRDDTLAAERYRR